MRSLRDRIIRKFRFACIGVWTGITQDKSIALQCVLGLLTVLVCAFLPLSVVEWCVILILIFLVIILEFINSAIEKTVDYISLEKHPLAKQIKDLAAGAVLLMSVCALLAAILIVGGKLI